MLTSSSEPMTDKIFVELVRSLYTNMMPARIMWMAFALVFILVYREHPDSMLLVLGSAALLTQTFRLGVSRAYRNEALTAVLNRLQARKLEIAFAVPYVGFAILLGLFGARAFWLTSPQTHMLIICLLVGYCAGVATGASMRPSIAIPSMVAAIGPTVVISLLHASLIYIGMSIIIVGFLAGGVQSVLLWHEAARAQITKRLASVSLARHDILTALPNRLALREYFEDRASTISPNGLIAVHYLDLDNFKPVNDSHGHAVGDSLLAAVAGRLRRAIRGGDIVARLGGDEFAVIQFGLHRAEEAELLSRRIRAAIAQPFDIGDSTISISPCIGTVVSHNRNDDLDLLLQQADEKLYARKRARSAPPPLLNIA